MRRKEPAEPFPHRPPRLPKRLIVHGLRNDDGAIGFSTPREGEGCSGGGVGGHEPRGEDGCPRRVGHRRASPCGAPQLLSLPANADLDAGSVREAEEVGGLGRYMRSRVAAAMGAPPPRRARGEEHRRRHGGREDVDCFDARRARKGMTRNGR